MSEHDEAIKQDTTAAGNDPAAGAGSIPLTEAVEREPLEGDPALAGDDSAGPQGDPLAGQVPAGGDGLAKSSADTDDLEILRARAAERDQYLALAQRAQADFENFRRRAARETAQAMDRGAGRLAKELLPALDHLELALKAGETEGGELFKGVRMVQDEMLGALARVGIEAFAPAGEPFDPN